MAVTIDAGEVQNRLWGIPFLGVAVRSILLIPHFLVILVLSIAARFCRWSSGSRSC